MEGQEEDGVTVEWEAGPQCESSGRWLPDSWVQNGLESGKEERPEIDQLDNCYRSPLLGE